MVSMHGDDAAGSVDFPLDFSMSKKNCFHVGRAIQHRKSSGAQIALYSLPGPGDAMWMSCTGASVAFNRERHEIMRSRKFKL